MKVASARNTKFEDLYNRNSNLRCGRLIILPNPRQLTSDTEGQQIVPKTFKCVVTISAMDSDDNLCQELCNGKVPLLFLASFAENNGAFVGEPRHLL